MDPQGIILLVSCLVFLGVVVIGQQEGTGQFQPEQSGKLPYVTIFEHWFYGRHWNISAVDCRCRNFPQPAVNLITSIHTNGNCVILFKDKGCFGRGLRMEDYSHGYNDLGWVGHNDATAALQKCGCYENSDDFNNGNNGGWNNGGGTTERAYV